MKVNCRLHLPMFSSGGGKEPNRRKLQKKRADTGKMVEQVGYRSGIVRLTCV